MIKDTREILANAQQTSESPHDPAPEQSRHEESAPLTNGKVRKSSSTKRVVSAPTPAAVSSAIKPPPTLLRSAQPTPSRETSILGNLKPRRRQPSILQDLGNDSSTFDLADEEQFLPDDESTPYNLSKSHNVPITPATNSSSQLSTSSKKRKFGSSDPVQSHMDERPTTSPLATMGVTTASPEPALPPMPASTLRESGKKYRERAPMVEDDILAPPESSSSSPSSPAKRTKTKPSKPGTTITTEQLRALMMPTRRRKTMRERTRVLSEFDIPVDPDANSDDVEIFDDEGDESTFLPTQRKSRKTRGKEQPLSKTKPGRRKPQKASAGGGAAKPTNLKKQQATAAATATDFAARAAKSKTKSSTEHFTAATAPVLTPSTSTTTCSRRNRKTKSPSQLFRTIELSATSVETENPHKKSYGGSHPRRTSRGRRRDTATADKENRTPEDFSCTDSPLREGGSQGERSRGAEGEEANARERSTVITSKGKWADIDAWDMDFEDVEVMTGSSGGSPMRR